MKGNFDLSKESNVFYFELLEYYIQKLGSYHLHLHVQRKIHAHSLMEYSKNLLELT